MFLDIDHKICTKAYDNFDEKVGKILKMLHSQFDVTSWIVLDSSTNCRKSFHTICPCLIFDTVQECGHKVEELRMSRVIDRDLISIIDFSPYKKSQQFRLFGRAKFGRENCLRLHPLTSVEFQQSSSGEVFVASQVRAFLKNIVPLLGETKTQIVRPNRAAAFQNVLER